MKYQLTELKNGIKVIAVSTPEFKSIYFNISVRGGANIESKSNNGISHFVEHMMLEGSKNFPDKHQFDEQIEYLGGSYNASTYRNKVVVSLALPSNKLNFGLKYLYDVSFNANFDSKPLASERNAILDEIHNLDSNPYRKFNDFWQRNRYQKDGTPLKLGGVRSKIKSMSRKSLLDWYSYIMTPNNMTISIVGNIDTDEALKQVEEIFSGRKNHTDTITEQTYREMKYSDFKIRTQVDKVNKQSIGTVSFPSYSMYQHTYRDRQTAKILEAVIANYRSSILYKRLRKELGLIYDISADQSFGETYPGILEFIFTTSDDLIEQVYEIVFDELSKLYHNGIDGKLWKHGIESGNNSLLMGYSSLAQVVGWYTPPVFWFNKVLTIDEAIKIRSSITVEEANKAIKELLNPEKMNIISRVNKESVKKKLEKSISNKLAEVSYSASSE